MHAITCRVFFFFFFYGAEHAKNSTLLFSSRIGTEVFRVLTVCILKARRCVCVCVCVCVEATGLHPPGTHRFGLRVHSSYLYPTTTNVLRHQRAIPHGRFCKKRSTDLANTIGHAYCRGNLPLKESFFHQQNQTSPPFSFLVCPLALARVHCKRHVKSAPVQPRVQPYGPWL